MDPEIQLSVIIPSYNGAHKLVNALSCLDKQSFRNFEVIIVIDGSTDNSVEVVKQHRPFYKLTIIEQKNMGRSGSRNNGVDNAVSNLLVFVDDDMLIEDEFLSKHFEFHKQNKNSVLVGSAFRNPESAKSDFDKYLTEVEKDWKKNINEEFKVTLDRFAFTGANFSITKDNFNKVGRFKGILPDTEDFDFGVRTYLANISIYYNIHVIAWHNDFPTIENFIKRLQEYKKSNQKLVELNPLYRELFPKHFEQKKPTQLKLVILKIILKLRPEKWLINNRIVNLLPLKVNFLIYRLISSAKLNCS